MRAHASRGMALAELGRFAEAATDLRAALALGNDEPQVVGALALCLLETGRGRRGGARPWKRRSTPPSRGAAAPRHPRPWSRARPSAAKGKAPGGDARGSLRAWSETAGPSGRRLSLEAELRSHHQAAREQEARGHAEVGGGPAAVEHALVGVVVEGVEGVREEREVARSPPSLNDFWRRRSRRFQLPTRRSPVIGSARMVVLMPEAGHPHRARPGPAALVGVVRADQEARRAARRRAGSGRSRAGCRSACRRCSRSRWGSGRRCPSGRSGRRWASPRSRPGGPGCPGR